MTRHLLWAAAILWGVGSAGVFEPTDTFNYWVGGALLAFVGGGILALIECLLTENPEPMPDNPESFKEHLKLQQRLNDIANMSMEARWPRQPSPSVVVDLVTRQFLLLVTRDEVLELLPPHVCNDQEWQVLLLSRF